MGVKGLISGRAVLLITLALLLSLTAAVSAQEPTIEIDGDDPLTGDWQMMGGPGEIVFTVFNLTTSDVDITYQIDELKTADGTPLDPAPDLPVEIYKLPASSGDSYAVSLAILGGLGPGTYSATLIVSDLSNDFVELRDVSLTVVDPDAPLKKKPEPLQEAWTSGAERWVMLFSQPLWMRSDILPLDVPYQGVEEAEIVNLDLEKDVELGKLVNENGRIASVSWNGEIVETDQELAGIELEFDGLDDIGAYEGEITLPGPEGEETVALTANVTTFIIWPIIFILGALGITVLSKRWMDKDRKIDRLRFRLRDLVENRYPAKLADFRDIGYPLPPDRDAAALPCKLDQITYMLYDMGADLDKTVQQMLGDEPGWEGKTVSELKKLTQLELADDNAGYVKMQSDIDKLEETVDSWPGFGQSLLALDKALREMADDLAAAKVDKGEDPAFIAQACGYLKGSDSLKVSAYEKLPAKIDEATALVKEWPKMVRNLNGHFKVVAAIKLADRFPADEEEEKDLNRAEDYLEDVDGLLWLEPDVSVIVAETNKLMREAEILLRTLRKKYPPPATSSPFESGSGAKALAGTMESFLMPGAWSKLLAPVLAAKSQAAEREKRDQTAEEIRRKMRFYDLLILFITASLTVYAGLELRYFDKNFGTPWDFFFLLALGLTGGVAADTVIKHLGNFLSSSGLGD